MTCGNHVAVLFAFNPLAALLQLHLKLRGDEVWIREQL
jgi:hypothetical protein